MASVPDVGATVPDAPVMNADAAVAQGAGWIGMGRSTPDNGGLPIIGYNVYARLAAGEEDYDSAPLNGATPVPEYDTVYAAQGLTGGQTYYFTVKAVNELGESDPSGETSATAIDVPGAPTGLQAVPVDGSVTLSWAAPADNGGAITSYEIWAGDAADSLGSLTWQDASEGNQITISNLDNGKTYWFAVSANNDAGGGDQSGAVSATPSRRTSAPELSLGAVGNGSITVTWTAPADDGGSAITGYNLYGCDASGPCEVRRTSAPLPADASSYTIDNPLLNGTTYYITVTAQNAVGESDPSNEASAMPGAPTNVSAATAPPGKRAMSATVTWSDDASAKRRGGAPGGTRTHGLQVRNLTLYPLSYGRTLRLAEREGFEPSVQVTPHGGLANRCTRPLCDLSAARAMIAPGRLRTRGAGGFGAPATEGGREPDRAPPGRHSAERWRRSEAVGGHPILGAADEGLGRIALLGARPAEGEADQVSGARHRRRAGHADPLDEVDGRDLVGLAQQDAEARRADAREVVAGARHAPEALGGLAQRVVRDLLAPDAQDAVHAVDVEDDHRGGTPVAR